MTIENIYRNRTMNEITEGDVGQTLKVAGWVENIRDHGGVSFIQVTSAELYITDSPLSLCTAPPRTMRHCILQPTTNGAGRELAIPSGAFAVCCVAAMIALSATTVKGELPQFAAFC